MRRGLLGLAFIITLGRLSLAGDLASRLEAEPVHADRVDELRLLIGDVALKQKNCALARRYYEKVLASGNESQRQQASRGIEICRSMP